MKKKNKTIYAWAIVGMYKKNAICFWPNIDRAEQYHIFISREDAEKSKKIWDRNWGITKIIRVKITI